LLYYRPSMALCNICIDLQGWRKCRKIAWSNRGHHIPVGHVGKEREHDCMDAGGRAPTVGALGDAGAVAEGAEAFPALRLPEKLPLLLTLLTYIHVGNTRPCCRRAGLFRPTSVPLQYSYQMMVLNRLVYIDERRSVGMINKIIASIQYDWLLAF
jgi:hypothetical protein